MKRSAAMILALAMTCIGGAARAKDDKACPAGTVCASKPDTVVTALQQAGYSAKLDKDNEGDPSVSSSAAGYPFDVLFYGCEGHAQCDSLQFRLTFSAYDSQTAELANLWNRDKRFLQASVRADKSMIFAYDLATIGGVNQANFSDVLAWWSSELGEVDKFFREHPPGKKVPS